MSTTNYPPQSFDKMSRKQAIMTCIALEDMRDRALAEVERIRGDLIRSIQETWVVENDRDARLERVQAQVRRVEALLTRTSQGTAANSLVTIKQVRAALQDPS